MTGAMIFVLALLALAMVCFAAEWLSVDVVTLLLLAALVVGGILTPEQAFSGFANEIIVVLGSLFVLSGTFAKTGVLEGVGRMVGRFTRGHEGRTVGIAMAASASLSAMFSNTSATAILLPAVSETARRGDLRVSRILMPVAFASILGGTCTLIGTSTNMAASALMERMGLAPYGLFEFAPAALILVVAGLVYLGTVGYRLLPDRGADLSSAYELRAYLTRARVPDGSPLADQAIRELTDLRVEVASLQRGDERLPPHPLRKLRAGDVVDVRGAGPDLVRLLDQGALLREAPDGDAAESTSRVKVGMIEAVLMPGSRLIGRTVGSLDLPRRFGLALLGVYRRGHAYPHGLGRMRLQAGDVLLLQGPREEFAALHGNHDLWGLAELPVGVGNPRQGFVALGLLAAAVIVGATGLVPLSIGFLLAALGVVLAGHVTIEEAYSFVEWRLLILIGGMTGFGIAMTETGTAEYLAAVIASWAASFGVSMTLAAFAVLTIALTQPLSNAAAVLVVLPVALASAEQMGVAPRTFAVGVTLAASLSFLTPLEPACLLVYGPGRYRFRDFVVAGLPLTVVTVILLVLLVPVFWPP